jgi:hypothetical protein
MKIGLDSSEFVAIGRNGAIGVEFAYWGRGVFINTEYLNFARAVFGRKFVVGGLEKHALRLFK